MNLKSLFAERAARVTLVMSCLFAMNGVALPFLPRWLEAERGLDGAAIGLVMSLPMFARIVLGPAIAFWADGCADRRTPLRVLSITTLLAYAGFFFIPHDLAGLMLWGLAAIAMSQGLFPLAEAALLRASLTGAIPYGVARGLGSAAFVFGNVVGGIAISRFGMEALVAWMLCAFALLGLSSWSVLPSDPSPVQALAGVRARLRGAAKLIFSPRYLVVVVGCGLIQGAHGFYYAFSTLVWRGQGVGAETIGLLWAVGVAAEIAFLWSLTTFERRLSPEALILIGGGGATLRWILLGFGPLGPVLWPIQAMHALSFAATHVGAMRILFREAPEESQALAQTVYHALAGGVLIGASILVSGVLYDGYAAKGYWAMALMAACGTGVALFLLALPARAAPR